LNIFDLAGITTAVEADGDDDNAGFGERVEDVALFRVVVSSARRL
jgi:hypothetical protein